MESRLGFNQFRRVAMTAVLAAAITSQALAAGYLAVWRPGTGDQWVQSGISVEQFKTWEATYYKQGLRIVSLVVRDGRFTAVWQPGTGEQRVHAGLSGAAFKTQDTAYFKKGLRIAAFSIDGGRFAAVWRPGSGAQWNHAGLSAAEFKTLDTGYFKKGLRITQLEIDGGKFAAVWRPGKGTQWVHWDMSGAQLEAKDAVYFPQGLRIATMSVDGGGKYAAVWRADLGTGTQYVGARRCWVDFKAEDLAYYGQGLRLGFLKLEDKARGLYHYPWKNGDSYTVGQGNNNPSGSHNGSQAFAFDFSLPSGTQVRAARAGIVEWVKQSQTSSFNPTQPESATNVKFPNGSLDNWGNAVRIRHLGGFTSWYFHLQPNSALVEEEEMVKAGQPIALSDNTGRSGAAHLHFQVQADSSNWGQSIPISFNDCDVPAKGASVTSQNQ